MKQETIDKANELIKSRDILLDLDHTIFSKPYPSLIYRKRSDLTFWHDDYKEVCFVSLDKQTQNELKEAIRNVLHKRIVEIDDEIKEL